MRAWIEAHRAKVGWAAALGLIPAMGLVYLLSATRQAQYEAAFNLVFVVVLVAAAGLATRTHRSLVAYLAMVSLVQPIASTAGFLFRDFTDPQRWPDGTLEHRWDPAAVPAVTAILVASMVLAFLALYGLGPAPVWRRPETPAGEDWRSLFSGRPPGPEDDRGWTPTPPAR